MSGIGKLIGGMGDEKALWDDYKPTESELKEQIHAHRLAKKDKISRPFEAESGVGASRSAPPGTPGNPYIGHGQPTPGAGSGYGTPSSTSGPQPSQAAAAVGQVVQGQASLIKVVQKISSTLKTILGIMKSGAASMRSAANKQNLNNISGRDSKMSMGSIVKTVAAGLIKLDLKALAGAWLLGFITELTKWPEKIAGWRKSIGDFFASIQDKLNGWSVWWEENGHPVIAGLIAAAIPLTLAFAALELVTGGLISKILWWTAKLGGRLVSSVARGAGKVASGAARGIKNYRSFGKMDRDIVKGLHNERVNILERYTSGAKGEHFAKLSTAGQNKVLQGALEKTDIFKMAEDAPKIGRMGRIGSSLKSAFGFGEKSLAGAGAVTKEAGVIGRMMSSVVKMMPMLGRVATILKAVPYLGEVIIAITALISFIPAFMKGYKKGGFIAGLTAGVEAVIKDIVVGFGDLLKSIVSWVLDELGFHKFSAALDKIDLSKVWDNIVGGIKDTIMSVFHWIGDIFSGFDPLKFMKKWVDSWDDSNPAMSALKSSALMAIKATGAVYGAAKSVGGFVADRASDAAEGFKTMGSTISGWAGSAVAATDSYLGNATEAMTKEMGVGTDASQAANVKAANVASRTPIGAAMPKPSASLMSTMQQGIGKVGAMLSMSAPSASAVTSAKASASTGMNGSMPSDFEQMVSRILKYEGGYVANDAGHGPTNMGINQRDNAGILAKMGVTDVRNMTVAQAKQVYKAKYYDSIGIGSLPAEMRMSVFDASVNQGAGYASKLVKQIKDGTLKTPDDVRRARLERYSHTKGHEKYLAVWTARTNESAGVTGSSGSTPSTAPSSSMASVSPRPSPPSSPPAAALASSRTAASSASSPMKAAAPVALVNNTTNVNKGTNVTNYPDMSAATTIEFAPHIT
jgi:lysozyme family protein